MTTKRGFLSLLLLAALQVLSACATTAVTGVWKDEKFEGTFQKVAVIGLTSDMARRTLFEDEFVKQLKSHGVDALASYPVIPHDQLTNLDAVNGKVKGLGADAILLTRLVSKETFQSYVSGAVPDYSHWTEDYHRYISEPGYLVQDEYLFLETNLYATGTEKRVWSARSVSVLAGTDQETVASFVKVVIEKMASDRMIR